MREGGERAGFEAFALEPWGEEVGEFTVIVNFPLSSLLAAADDEAAGVKSAGPSTLLLLWDLSTETLWYFSRFALRFEYHSMPPLIRSLIARVARMRMS